MSTSHNRRDLLAAHIQECIDMAQAMGKADLPSHVDATEIAVAAIHARAHKDAIAYLVSSGVGDVRGSEQRLPTCTCGSPVPGLHGPGCPRQSTIELPLAVGSAVAEKYAKAYRQARESEGAVWALLDAACKDLLSEHAAHAATRRELTATRMDLDITQRLLLAALKRLGADAPPNRGAADPTNRAADPAPTRRTDAPANRAADPAANRGADAPANRGTDAPTNRSVDAPANRGAL